MKHREWYFKDWEARPQLNAAARMGTCTVTEGDIGLPDIGHTGISADRRQNIGRGEPGHIVSVLLRRLKRNKDIGRSTTHIFRHQIRRAPIPLP